MTDNKLRAQRDDKGSVWRERLVRGGVGVGILNLTSLPLSLLAILLLARGLGPEKYGQYAFVITAVMALSLSVGPAMMQLSTRETARLRDPDDSGPLLAYARWSHRWAALLCLPVTAVILAYSPLDAIYQENERWKLLLLSVLAVPALAFAAVRSGILSGSGRVVLARLPELLCRPAALVLLLSLLFYTQTLTLTRAVLCFVLSTFIALLVATLGYRHELSRLPPPASCGSSSEALWRRAWLPFTLLVSASTLSDQAGVILLGVLSTSEEVAAFHLAQRGAMFVALSLGIANMVISPDIARLCRREDYAALQLLSRRSARAAFIVALPLAIPLIVFGRPILDFAFGTAYADLSTAPLALMAFAQLINVAVGSVGALLIMGGHERSIIATQAYVLLLNFALALILIPFAGAVGAAIANAAGLILWNTVLVFKVVRYLGIKPGFL